MSEKAGFRDQLAQIIAAVPDRECLKMADVQRITGWTYRTCKKRLKFNRFGELTRAELARQLCV